MARKRPASSLDGDGTTHCILVAVDFGTTYTGIAYVYTSSVSYLKHGEARLQTNA
jgi:hypothetical protein